MTLCGIYIIKNTVNDKVYVGQSVNIKSRFLAHKHSADNYKRQDHNTQLHTAMRTLGIDNFYYEILEECPVELLDEREIYWISYYDSYNNGYNMTTGGEGNSYETNGRAILTLSQVEEIRLMYGARIPFKEAYSRYENIISKRGFKKVWHYETWRGILPEVYSDENKQWHATMSKRHQDGNVSLGKNNVDRACSDEEIAEMRRLRSEEGLSYEKIANIVGRSTSVVRKYCLHREAKNPHAQADKQPNSVKVRNIETGLVFDSLKKAAAWANVKDGGKHIRKIVSNIDYSLGTSGTVPSTGERAHWELA